jgi:hypothetical protein
MKSPNQSTVKTFLNVTTYKPLEKNPNVGLPQPKTIDITELLKENNVESFYNINGISQCDVGETDEYGANPIETRFVIDEMALTGLANDVFSIIDASIVNQKQSEAVKKLITSVFDSLKSRCWEDIHPTML